MSSGPRQQSLFLNVPSPSLVCLVFCCIFQVVSSGSRSATSTDLALVSISLIAPSRLRLHIASGPRPPSGGEMSPTCQPANQRRGPVSKGGIPNLLRLYSRSYPTKPLNHFFLCLRTHLTACSEVYGQPQVTVGEASVWALQTLIDEVSTIPGSGRGRDTLILFFHFDSKNSYWPIILYVIYPTSTF